MAVAISGCSRRPDSHASAASSAPTKIVAKAAVRRKPSRPDALVAIFGIVTAADTAAPVSGCRVEAFSEGEPHAALGPYALTNAAGMFALDGKLGPGKYTFGVTKGKVFPFYPPIGVWPPVKFKFKAAKGEATARLPVSIPSSASWYKLVHLKLPREASGPAAKKAAKENPGAAIFGQVTEPDGIRPLLGAQVSVLRGVGRGSPQVVTAAIPNKLGLFVLMKGRLDPGKYWVRADCRSWHPDADDIAVLSRLTVGASSRGDIILRLKAGSGSVEGRVVDSLGHPIGKATVTLIGARQPSLLRFYTANTDAKGHYSLRYVPLGTYVGSMDWKKYSSPEYVVVVGKRPVHRDFRIGR